MKEKVKVEGKKTREGVRSGQNRASAGPGCCPQLECQLHSSPGCPFRDAQPHLADCGKGGLLFHEGSSPPCRPGRLACGQSREEGPTTPSGLSLVASPVLQRELLWPHFGVGWQVRRLRTRLLSAPGPLRTLLSSNALPGASQAFTSVFTVS